MIKVLLIEDDKILLDMYKDKFIHEGYEVQTAIDGKEGFEKMLTFNPDIVLLDLIMPNKSGFDLLELRKNNQKVNKIPILVLTNIYADTTDLLQNWGVSYCLLKSNYTPEEVVEKVREILTQVKTK